MKKNYLIIVIVLTIINWNAFAASSGTKINSSSIAFLYGYAENKNDNYKPKGYAYKFQLGYRLPEGFESNLHLRYSNINGDITYSNINGNIKRSGFSGGLDIGFWLLSFLKLNLGYSIHAVTYDTTGSFSSNQKDSIKQTYDLNTEGIKGLTGGVDLALFQTSSFQFFTNYTHYHLLHKNSNDWEASAGFRFYPSLGKSSGGGTPGWFSNLIDKIVGTK